MVGFGLLTAGGIVSIAERGQGFTALFVLQPGDPVGLVIGIGFLCSIGISQTGPVAVGIVGIGGLEASAFADRGQTVFTPYSIPE